MNLMRTSTAPRSARVALISVFASLLACLGSLGSTPARAQNTDAIWKTHRVIFQYGSRSTAYSCKGLADKLSAILRRVGAHQDLRILATACDESAGLARLEVLFRSPVPATPANLTEATDHDATELLTARLRGERLATAEDVERFEAQWETISLGRDRKLKLVPSDCDLLRQMTSELFSRMSINVTKRNARCSALGNFHPPHLTVAALVPTQQLPGAAEL
jgi:hypothetical protein